MTVLDSGELGCEVVENDLGDVYGHGTACAGIIRSLAPACEIHSVRVLGAKLKGGGRGLLEGLRWAIAERYDVINLSLSATRAALVAELHEVSDAAFFRSSVLVCSAHNMPVESYPWRFAAVISVGSHAGSDPFEYFCNPSPPVEFFAPGVDVEVAWRDGATIRASGNSFATPHISGLVALVLGKHPGLTSFEVKSALRACASNVRPAT
jgi:subtilisin